MGLPPLGKRKPNMFGLPMVGEDELDDLLAAVRVLAQMAKNAPSYEVTVKPFADAHQEACQVLDRLQKHGIEEAS